MNHLIFLEAESKGFFHSKLIDVGNDLVDGVINLIIKLIIAWLLFIVGKRLINWCLKLLNKIFARWQVDQGVITFTSSMAKIGLYVLLIFFIFQQLNIETNSFIAIFGSAGLALGLALQGSLANFAGGILILIIQPFHVGDFIIVGTNEGTVTSIDIFYTSILTADNRKIVLPNGALSNSDIINVTNESIRRVDLIISIGYECDIKEAKQVLHEIFEKSEYAEKSKEPDIFVNSFDDHSVGLMFRVWTAKENYLATRSELLENIKYAFDERGISIPYHQLDVYVKNIEELKTDSKKG